MTPRRRQFLRLAAAIALLAYDSRSAHAQSQAPAGSLANEPLVDLRTVDTSIVIDLRYATARNITGSPLYPPSTPCLVRAGTAIKLKAAEALLATYHCRLKIWDAYRPPSVQMILWRAIKNPEFVADPTRGRSMHAWGVAVDATLVDSRGRELRMPTDFDSFTPDAAIHIDRTDPTVIKDLRLLQGAMGASGFFGMKGEWWHFVDKDWMQYYGPNHASGTIPTWPAKP